MAVLVVITEWAIYTYSISSKRTILITNARNLRIYLTNIAIFPFQYYEHGAYYIQLTISGENWGTARVANIPEALTSMAIWLL